MPRGYMNEPIPEGPRGSARDLPEVHCVSAETAVGGVVRKDRATGDSLIPGVVAF